MLSRLTYANVVSTLALVLALGLGGAYAASKIGSKDIKRGAVRSKTIKDRTIKGKDVGDAGLTGADLADGSVAAADLAPSPPVVNLQLGNGGEGDCLWLDGTVDFPTTSPVSLRRNAFGEVTLQGAAGPANGPGGDAVCGGAGAESLEDSQITTIPAEHRPALSQLFTNPSSGALIIVAGANGLQVGPTSIAAGTVVSSVSDPAFLGYVSFLAADAPNSPAPASGRDRIDRSALRSLGL